MGYQYYIINDKLPTIDYRSQVLLGLHFLNFGVVSKIYVGN